MQRLFASAFALFLTANLFAQHEPIQPFEELGIKVRVLTLSNGKYQESFPNDTIFRFGAVMFNRVTGEVVSVVLNDTLYGEYNLKPEVVSRWLSPDPMTNLYPNLSPYNYTMNNPLKYVDPDGSLIVDGNGNIVVTSTGNQIGLQEQLPSYVDSRGNNIQKVVEATYNEVIVYANDGTPIRALEYVSSREIVTVTNAETGELVDRGTVPLDKNLDLQSNCFGFAMCNGKLLINDPAEVNKLVSSDYQNAEKSEADIALLNDGKGDPVHAAKVNPDGTYSDKGGFGKPQSNVGFDKVQAGINGFAPPEKYKSRNANNVVDTTLGTEQDGIRKITKPDEIEEFLKLIKND